MRQTLSKLFPSAVALAACLALASPGWAADYRLLLIDGLKVKWGAPAMRSGAEVSYGFATAERSFPDAVNCRELAPMAELAAAWGGDPARLAEIAADAFAIWSREADLRFRPAAPGETPDILIGAEGAPRRIAFADVWHGAGAGGIAPLTQAILCFNPEVAWSGGPGPAPAGALDLGTVLAHEIGHAIGLDHPGASGPLMALQQPGRHGPPDAGGHRRGGGALRRGGLTATAQKDRLPANEPRGEDAGAGPAAGAERRRGDDACGTAIVPGRRAPAAAKGVFVPHRPRV